MVRGMGRGGAGRCSHRFLRGFIGVAAGHIGPALQRYIFVGQGPCALPDVQYTGRTPLSARCSGLHVVRRGGALPLPWAG